MIEEILTEQALFTKASTEVQAASELDSKLPKFNFPNLGKSSSSVKRRVVLKFDDSDLRDLNSRGFSFLLGMENRAGKLFEQVVSPRKPQNCEGGHQMPPTSAMAVESIKFGLPILESRFSVCGSPSTRKTCQIFYCGPSSLTIYEQSKAKFVAKVVSNKPSNKRALQEAQILKSLTAAKELVPEFVDCWVESKKTVTVMKRCHTDLEHLLSVDRDATIFPQSRFLESLRMLSDVTKTLISLNNLGFAHLDVKPENVFVNPGRETRSFQFCSEVSTHLANSSVQERNIPGSESDEMHVEQQIKYGTRMYLLSDFGLAESIITVNKFGVFTGDHTYMPLETLDMDQTGMDLCKLDIYSLGLVAFRMITQQILPKNGASWDELRKNPAVISEALERVSCPSGLSDLLKKCLARNPDDRPSPKTLLESVEILSKELSPQNRQ